MPSSPSDWIAWLGIVVPLMAIAWSAVRYVAIEADKNRQRRYERFFQLMEQIGRNDYSIAAKMAAVHELKKYSAYREVILRLCIEPPVQGPAADLLLREFRLTAEHFGYQSPPESKP